MRLKIERDVLREANAAKIDALEDEVRRSECVRTLLSERAPDGTISERAYKKWNGPHWVLVMLAELGYPRGDETLGPLRDHVLEWITSGEDDPDEPVLGRFRAHASMHGNVVFAATRLGIADDRLRSVVDKLLEYQWPDGGWNCDRRPEAKTSSFTHSAIALRGLAAWATVDPSPRLRGAIERAAELFLVRRLYRRASTGEVIKHEFTQLNYPYYHMYNVLFGLLIMSEAGFIHDPRCSEALDLIESRFVSGQGLVVDAKYFHHTKSNPHRYTPVRWERAKLGSANQFLTADALVVLRRSGRLGVGIG